jgi:hypothetical protein
VNTVNIVNINMLPIINTMLIKDIFNKVDKVAILLNLPIDDCFDI